MTRDEILNMEAGRKMDALIAEKVMGLPPEWTHFEPHGKEFDTSIGRVAISEVAHYSTDIAAAWEVMEKMSKRYDIVVGVCGGLASCKILREVEHDWKWEMIVEQIYESSPFAICKAALLALMEE